MRKLLASVFPYVAAIMLVFGFVAWHVGPAPAGQAASPAASGGSMPPAPFAVPITQPGKTPAYTVDDARRFVATYQRADFNTVSGAPFTIDDVRFVTREQAEQIMRGESLAGQIAPSDLVCVVTLTGPFTGDTIPVPPGISRRTWHPTYITLVFDAQTGYLITEWFHD